MGAGLGEGGIVLRVLNLHLCARVSVVSGGFVEEVTPSHTTVVEMELALLFRSSYWRPL